MRQILRLGLLSTLGVALMWADTRLLKLRRDRLSINRSINRKSLAGLKRGAWPLPRSKTIFFGARIWVHELGPFSKLFKGLVEGDVAVVPVGNPMRLAVGNELGDAHAQ